MGMIKIPKNSIDFFEKNYKEIFATGNLAEGKWSKEISKWINNYTKSKYSIAVNSNGAGIYSILRILKEYYNKDKIFLQSNTMYGVRTIAVSSGLNLSGYVDCSLKTLMPSFEQVENYVKNLDAPEKSVFLITHIGGWINPDIKKIAELCSYYGISLIEDCAHSLGSTINSEHSGLFGQAGVYSLYATKAIPAGEGGIIVSNDTDLSNKIEKFIIYDRFDQELDIGINIRMSELNALLSFAVIKNTEEIIENEYKIAERYIQNCERFKWNFIHPRINKQRSNLYKFILIANTSKPEKEFAQIKLRTSPVYDYSLSRDNEEIRSKHICLPIWYNLEEEEVSKVSSQLER